MAENDLYVSRGASSSSSTASSFVNEDGAGSNSSAIAVSPDGKISRDSATVFTDGATSSSAKATASASTDKPPMTSATANAPVLTEEVIAKSVFISGDDHHDHDNKDLLIKIEGTFTEPGSYDLHRGTAHWSDGFSKKFDISQGTRTFTTSRFFSQEKLEEFPEIDRHDNNIFKIGINLTVTDNYTKKYTKLFEFFVAESGGIFVPEDDTFV